jgi:hypothetical protein
MALPGNTRSNSLAENRARIISDNYCPRSPPLPSLIRRGWLLLSLLIVIPGCVNGVGWLPDSSGFVFTTDGGPLVLYDVKTKAARVVVADTRSNTYWPAVSPDGARIAIARLRFDDQHKSHLQVVVYDLKGKAVHESKSIPWGRSDQKPDDELNATTQLFWGPAGKKLLIYGSIHGYYGTTGLYDLNSGATTLFERTVPCIYGGTPVRPDGKGFVLANIANNSESLEKLSWVDWYGQVKPMRARFDLSNDDLTLQLVWPVLRWSAWDGDTAVATTPAGRTRIDTDKAEATLQPVARGPTSFEKDIIWMQHTLPTGIQVLVLTPTAETKEKKPFHTSRTITWDPKNKKQLALVAKADDHLVGLFPAPDQKHVVFRIWEGDRVGPGADMIYLINAQGTVVETIDVNDRFGKKE